jgi:UDP:flavonoid glycosyltransferase YjiC (YdhE family)
MRFLLNTIGTAGDVHPFIAVGAALKARGHEVTILTNPHFSERINRVGLGFWPLGDETGYQRMVTGADLVHPSRGPRYVLNSLILPAMEPTVEAMTNIVRATRPEAVLAHHICFAMPAACRQLSIPCATAVLSPLFWLSRDEPIVYPNLPIENLPRWADRVLRKLMRPYARLIIDRPVNHERRRLSLPSVRDMIYHEARGLTKALHRRDAAPPRRVLALWSPHYRAAMPDDPNAGQASICGFCWFDRAAAPTADPESDAAVRGFLEGGPPPIIFTLGTSVVHHGRDFYDLAAAACHRIGKRGLLLVGSAEAARRPWPDGVLAVPYAPFSRVLPRGRCTVHHGGIGTTAQAMRAGSPSLIIPFANDEFDNAARVKRLGIGMTLSRGKLTERTLAATLEKLLADKPMAALAQIMGRKLVSEDGAEVAAEAMAMVAARGLVENLRGSGPTAPSARKSAHSKSS